MCANISFTRDTWLISIYHLTHTCVHGVATISVLLKIVGLVCKRTLYNRWYSAKQTYNFKEPTNRSRPIAIYILIHACVYWLISMTHLNTSSDDVAVCCSVLQCVAVCCSVLQCVAVCCSAQWLISIHHYIEMSHETHACVKLDKFTSAHQWSAIQHDTFRKKHV